MESCVWVDQHKNGKEGWACLVAGLRPALSLHPFGVFSRGDASISHVFCAHRITKRRSYSQKTRLQQTHPHGHHHASGPIEKRRTTQSLPPRARIGSPTRKDSKYEKKTTATAEKVGRKIIKKKRTFPEEDSKARGPVHFVF